jgi:tubulin monoglycylase TTLL3/8
VKAPAKAGGDASPRRSLRQPKESKKGDPPSPTRGKTLREWKAAHNVPEHARVYAQRGYGKTLKDALDDSGELWVENDAKTVYDVWFSMEEHHVPWETLEPHQVANHIEGFQKNLDRKDAMIRTLHAAQDVTGETNEWYLPSAFCLGDPKEYDAFLDHYKLSHAEALLKRWRGDPKSVPEKAVRVAVQVLSRQVAHTKETFDGNATDPGPARKKEAVERKSSKDDSNAEGKKKRSARSTEKNQKSDDLEEMKSKLVLDSEWAVLEDGPLGKKKAPEGRRLRNSLTSEIGERDSKQAKAEGFDGSKESLQEAVETLLKELADDPQYNLRGQHNLWILKPSGTLMGSGIELCRTLSDVTTLVKSRRFMAWVAQKYIEDPLLVNGRKFDIRQWVLVVCRGENLEAYFLGRHDSFCSYGV